MALRGQIEQALQHLVGMPLWDAGRAADMQCFDFGARHQITNCRGEPAEVGDYALHIQCGWRIVGPAGIVVGRRDLFYPAGDDPYQDLDDFDYEGPLPNRRDVRLAALLEERESAPLVVESCSADDVGGFRLNLTGGFTLEVWPATPSKANTGACSRPLTMRRTLLLPGVGSNLIERASAGRVA